jgi:hypothetical protein
MPTFILLYDGPPTPPDASHEGWPEWFERMGDQLVDIGSPMLNGFVVQADGRASNDAADINGYSLVRAESREQVIDALRDHPFISGGDEYKIQVFEVPRKR